MSVAKVTEITASSSKSFDDALRVGLERANKTLKHVTSAWIQDQEVAIDNGKISEYKVRMKVTFVLMLVTSLVASVRVPVPMTVLLGAA